MKAEIKGINGYKKKGGEAGQDILVTLLFFFL